MSDLQICGTCSKVIHGQAYRNAYGYPFHTSCIPISAIAGQVRETVQATMTPPDVVKQGPSTSALDVQEGGDHYKSMKIQPVEFIHANGLGFLEGCVIKRICRWRRKNGIEDLRKIKHEVDLLIQLEGEK